MGMEPFHCQNILVYLRSMGLRLVGLRLTGGCSLYTKLQWKYASKAFMLADQYNNTPGTAGGPGAVTERCP